MKKLFKLMILVLPYAFFGQGSDIYYNEIPNFFNGDNNESLFKLEVNYSFGNKQIQGSYIVSDRFFTFATYNYNNTTTETRSLFGDLTTDENQNSGYSFGLGYQGFGNIGNYNNLEVLIGFENQKQDITSYFSSNKNLLNRNEEILNQSYFKFFAQFNMIKTKRNYDSGFSLKFAYFKFTENPSYNDQTNLFIAPSYSFNYKVLKNRDLVFTSQVGLSVPTNSFKTSSSGNGFSSTESNYIVGGVLKLGIQYNFRKNKNKA